MSTTTNTSPDTSGEAKYPNFNFEAVNTLLSTVKTALNEANKHGCYTLDQATGLNRSLEMLNQIIQVTKLYQDERLKVESESK